MPVIESLAEEFSGRARFVMVHLDREGTLSKAFGSSGVPDYIVFRNGVEVDRITLIAIGWLLEPRLRWMIEGAME
ncbi:MAG: hypothetical protein GY725_16400 [bacterium]|nr:hypothetical protein [bacterium]